MNQIAINIPDEATVLDIAKQAVAKHLHVITNGQRSVLSPIVPPGWSIQLSCESRKAKQLAGVRA